MYAEQFHRLGYLPVDRELDHTAWTNLIRNVHPRFEEKDVRRSEVEAMFGPASLVVGKRVLCYAPVDGTGWVFFDCFDEPVSRYEPGAGRYTFEPDHDPLVRCVRYPADTFDAGLVMTLYGKVLRWGPGWWIHQPDQLTPEQQAIAAQLHGIETHDPSTAPPPHPAAGPEPAGAQGNTGGSS